MDIQFAGFDEKKYEWIAKEFPGIWGDFTKLDKMCFKVNVLPHVERFGLGEDKNAIMTILFAYRSGLVRGEDKAKRRYKEEF